MFFLLKEATTFRSFDYCEMSFCRLAVLMHLSSIGNYSSLDSKRYNVFQTEGFAKFGSIPAVLGLRFLSYDGHCLVNCREVV